MASEGRLYLFLMTSIAIVASWWLGGVGSIFWCLPLLVLFLYRDPKRNVPASPLGIISPVDGEVVAVENMHDRLLNRDALCIRIKPSLLSVFTIRSVTEGKVMQYWLDIDKTPTGPCVATNKCRAVWLQTDENDDIVVLMQAHPIHQLHCRVATGERIGQGQRCGFLLFSRYVDVFLPLDTRVDIKVGEKVLGGESPIAHLIHR